MPSTTRAFFSAAAADWHETDNCWIIKENSHLQPTECISVCKMLFLLLFSHHIDERSSDTYISTNCCWNSSTQAVVQTKIRLAAALSMVSISLYGFKKKTTFFSCSGGSDRQYLSKVRFIIWTKILPKQQGNESIMWEIHNQFYWKYFTTPFNSQALLSLSNMTRFLSEEKKSPYSASVSICL